MYNIFFPGPVVNLPLTKDVGFLVYPSGYFITAQNAKLKFDREDRNDGQGYSVKTRIFSAPLAGMYHFFWNLLSDSTSAFRVDLMLNGNVKSHSYAGRRQFTTPSGSVYLRLKKGDQVYLQAGQSGGKVHASRYSTFGGELIRY